MKTESPNTNSLHAIVSEDHDPFGVHDAIDHMSLMLPWLILADAEERENGN